MTDNMFRKTKLSPGPSNSFVPITVVEVVINVAECIMGDELMLQHRNDHSSLQLKHCFMAQS